MDIFEVLVMLPGFEEEDLCVGVLGESAGHDAAGRASSGQVG